MARTTVYILIILAAIIFSDACDKAVKEWFEGAADKIDGAFREGGVIYDPFDTAISEIDGAFRKGGAIYDGIETAIEETKKTFKKGGYIEYIWGEAYSGLGTGDVVDKALGPLGAKMVSYGCYCGPNRWGCTEDYDKTFSAADECCKGHDQCLLRIRDHNHAHPSDFIVWGTKCNTPLYNCLVECRGDHMCGLYD